MISVLIVEDDILISELIDINLRNAGYECTCVYDGGKAADFLENQRFDLILLDIMLPGIDGYELLDYIRPLEIPVIVLSAKGEVQDKVKGLKLGAEDYLVKPFEIIELLARVEAVLRRYNKNRTTLTCGDVQVETTSRHVLKGVETVNLTAKEYELLVLFLQNKNIALSRERIYESVWEEEYTGDSRTVDLHVQRLRKKLGWEKQLVTIFKVGYRLED